MKDFVVYTVLTGGYEDIVQPVVFDDRFDYVLFTNDSIENTGVWRVRPIPEVISGDNKRLSRYPKTHPESLLSEYKASLYIDANVQIVDKWVYQRFIDLYGEGVEYAGIRLVLTGRDCIYEHSLDMCLWRLEYPSTAVKQCHALFEKGFPRHFGINENNVIFRAHSDTMKAVDEEWWRWIMTFSSRDQFSYMYCLWKYHVELRYFLPIGEDARNSSHFKLINHDRRTNVQRVKLVRLGYIRRLFLKSLRINPELGLHKWRIIYQSSAPMTYLYLVGLLSMVSYMAHMLCEVIVRPFKAMKKSIKLGNSL